MMKLTHLDSQETHIFVEPTKKINEGQDVAVFLVSQAYRDLTTFLAQLNHAMFPRKPTDQQDVGSSPIRSILHLQALLEDISSIVDKVPLDPGTHRFGNTAFRKWFQLLEGQITTLMSKHLDQLSTDPTRDSAFTALDELRAYLMGAFGSAQRLDYGTGHELSFLAFLAGIWKLDGFRDTGDVRIEKDIVMRVITPYLTLIRKLILKYSLEPAGSHGVWGLDDHSFLPYIFGSAQYGPAIFDLDATPIEGSSPGVPQTGDVVKVEVVERERTRNMYFGAIGFIYDVKKGPFWEHSRTLFDVSGVQDGWAKINKGMMKMYNAEVLSKFPVVQHFPFGSLFSFDRDPQAKELVSTIHTTNQPRREPQSFTTQSRLPLNGSAVSTSGILVSRYPSAAPRKLPVDLSARHSQDTLTEAASAGKNDSAMTRAPWAK